MQRLTYITLLVGLMMLSAFAGLWWNLLKPAKPLSSATPIVNTAPVQK